MVVGFFITNTDFFCVVLDPIENPVDLDEYGCMLMVVDSNIKEPKLIFHHDSKSYVRLCSIFSQPLDNDKRYNQFKTIVSYEKENDCDPTLELVRIGIF